jgi:hypothetical protein
MLLCRVCVLRRTIAITSSELWAGLSVSIGREVSEEPQPSPELIKMWMANDADAANHVLQFFFVPYPRWKNITLILPNHPFPTMLMDLDCGLATPDCETRI